MKTTLPFALLAALALVGCDDAGGITDKDTSDTMDSAEETDMEETDEETDETDETDVDTDDTDDETVTTFDLSQWATDWKDAITTACASGDTAGDWLLQLRSNNWSYNAQIWIGETRFSKDYDETHTMTETDQSTGPDGYSVWELDIAAGSSFVDGTSSVFACRLINPGDSANFAGTFAVRIDDDMGDLADCIVFGQSLIHI